MLEAVQSVQSGAHTPLRPLARPAFGSSPSPLTLGLEENAAESAGDYSGVDDAHFYEVTIGSVDQPKLLSRLTDALGDIHLNICEAHAFTTSDKYFLDVFVVNGWQEEGDGGLERMLSDRLRQLPAPHAESSPESAAELGFGKTPEPEAIEIDQTSHESNRGDWELDPEEVKFQERITSGAFGDLFRGNYCGQDVAVKVFKNVRDEPQQYQECLQEMAMMRKIRHKNVVQFIGACTRKPNFWMVFEFMAGGSIYDYLHKGGRVTFPQTLKIGVQIARGMEHLHKRNIIHRDLKSANLLMDEVGNVKIGDFGVARELDTAGVMTAETGTYRWMAPEVIAHSPYYHQADVFSFGIVLWELLTGQECWVQKPADRPSFEILKHRMEGIATSRQEEDANAKAQQSAPKNIFSKLRGGFNGNAGAELCNINPVAWLVMARARGLQAMGLGHLHCMVFISLDVDPPRCAVDMAGYYRGGDFESQHQAPAAFGFLGGARIGNPGILGIFQSFSRRRPRYKDLAC
ncbi:hypothetical protein WJX84_000463 [Apatococcus fuscideae]|uniref:non-specific serine/threonine protein kinase n=1 Tax=Apatococcus fuscideae TaxID=2026836 RepID=A0AAW1T5D9_9CHLO